MPPLWDYKTWCSAHHIPYRSLVRSAPSRMSSKMEDIPPTLSGTHSLPQPLLSVISNLFIRCTLDLSHCITIAIVYSICLSLALSCFVMLWKCTCFCLKTTSLSVCHYSNMPSCWSLFVVQDHLCWMKTDSFFQSVFESSIWNPVCFLYLEI